MVAASSVPADQVSHTPATDDDENWLESGTELEVAEKLGVPVRRIAVG